MDVSCYICDKDERLICIIRLLNCNEIGSSSIAGQAFKESGGVDFKYVSYLSVKMRFHRSFNCFKVRS